MRNKIKIGVVIAHFGSVSDTAECLTSLRKAQKKGYAIFVYLIDNDPQNRFLTSLSHFQLPGKIILSKKNIGYAAAVTRGSQMAVADRCEYVVHLSNDVVVRETIFTNIMPYFKIKNAGAISPMIVYYDKPNIVWCTDGYLNQRFLFARYPYMNRKIADVPYSTPIESEFGAACLFIKSSVFKKVGFLDKKYFLNVEDIEWCFRLRKKGYKLFYIPLPLALHKVSAGLGIRGTNMLTPLNAFFYARNFFVFLRDHKKELTIYTAIFGQTFIRLPFYIVFRASSPKAVAAYIKGYIYGLVYLLTGKLLS